MLQGEMPEILSLKNSKKASSSVPDETENRLQVYNLKLAGTRKALCYA